MPKQNQFPRLLSTGAIAALWQRPVSTVERCLLTVGASPVFALNGILYYDAVEADQALMHMIATTKAPPAIIGPPTGDVEFLHDEGDDGDEEADDDSPTPPTPKNRLAKILGEANHG